MLPAARELVQAVANPKSDLFQQSCARGSSRKRTSGSMSGWKRTTLDLACFRRVTRGSRAKNDNSPSRTPRRWWPRVQKSASCRQRNHALKDDRNMLHDFVSRKDAWETGGPATTSSGRKCQERSRSPGFGVRQLLWRFGFCRWRWPCIILAPASWPFERKAPEDWRTPNLRGSLVASGVRIRSRVLAPGS